MEKRNFGNVGKLNQGRKKGTFIVKIDSCQNDSWQGRIVWADENIEQRFRSTLELIRLIDEAVGNSEAESFKKSINF